jgi:hypothetical protein
MVALVKADVHLIIYATHKGETGHCGIAVDEYRIRVLEEIIGGKVIYRYDSVKTGTLIYYDLWPLKDSYKGNYEGNVAPMYYKLPSDRWKQFISLRTLSDQGVPHKFGYPCDGIISLSCSKKKDFEMMQYLDKKVTDHKHFNTMHHNCCDFVAEALTFMTGRQIEAKEYIIKNFATTPNQLFKVVAAWPGVSIIKDPGDKVNGSFVQERVLGRIMPVLSIFQLIIIIPSLL